MKHIKQPGFTIIEVVLFLAVSGLLAVGLMVGTGAAIQRQQYRDSVQSYANFLRDQYARVIAVENDRGAGACPLGPGDETQRGQSNCVITGRYIETNNGEGSQYEVYPLYAYAPSGSSTWTYGRSAEGGDTQYNTFWDMKTRLAGADGEFSLMMYRDPAIGALAIRTSESRQGSEVVNDFITSAPAPTEDAVEICVYETGFLAGERQSVFVSTVAGSGDAVTVGAATEGCRDA